MQNLGLIVADFLKGKSIYAPLRRVLSLLFTISIASYLFERFYGPYEWFDITDYKGIVDFLIKGDFFIPFSLFLIVHFCILWPATVIFKLIHLVGSQRTLRSVLAYKLDTPEGRRDVRTITSLVNKFSAVKLTPQIQSALYAHLRATWKIEDIAELEKASSELKAAIESKFIFFIQALVAISVYAAVLPAFTSKLYVPVVLALIGALYITVLGYRLFDVLPTLIAHGASEAIEFFDARMVVNTGAKKGEVPVPPVP